MRIALLLVLAGGCMSSEPVREGRVFMQLEDSDKGVVAYRMVVGSNDSECAHGEHFTPRLGADVRMGPQGGDLIKLAEQVGGAYTATATATHAPAYQFTVDGELFELAAPPSFSATIHAMSASQAMIELSDASVPSDVVIEGPDGRRMSTTLVGSPAVIDGDFAARGDYQVDLVRSVETEYGVVEVARRTAMTVR